MSGRRLRRPGRRGHAGLAAVLCLTALASGIERGHGSPAVGEDPVRDGSAACRPLMGVEGGTDQRGGLPSAWSVRPVSGTDGLRFRAVEEDDGGPFLRIASRDVAAFVYRRLERPPRGDRIVLRWSWRTRASIRGADLRVPDQDDSPLRVFVVFGDAAQEGLLEEGRSIFYSWGRLERRDARFRSHVSDRIGVWVLRGAEDVASGWQEERRDLAADYRRLFGDEPPPVRAVGFVADTDQTGASVVSDLRGLCIGSSAEA